MSSLKVVSTLVLLGSLSVLYPAVQAQEGRAKIGTSAADRDVPPIVDSLRDSDQPLGRPASGAEVDVPTWVLNGSSLGRRNPAQQSMGEVLWASGMGNASGDDSASFEDILQAHRSAIIGEYLYLHAGNVDVPYATPTDGTGLTAVPTGPSSMAAPTYQAGFRIGLNGNLTDSSSLSASYWFYESQSTHSTSLPGGGSEYLNPDLVHPNTASVDFLGARADHDLDLDIIDVHYRTTISEETFLAYLTVGVRYAQIEEDFRARYTIPGSTDVVTDIGFDGVGPRLGLEIERAMDGHFHMYLRGSASLVFGHFDADYRQSNVFDGGTLASVGLDDNRLVPITELELGLGWNSSTETFRFAAGYYIGSWFNTVTTGGFIDSVQDGSLYSVGGLGDTLVFDGLVARIEVRY